MGTAAPVDPEEWLATSQRYRLAVTEVVAPFGGYVAKGSGDNLMIYFGYPEAREDAAECAVRSGLGIIDALRAQKAMPADASDVGLAVRIGVHAGVVVIAKSGHDVDMFGEAPDIAAQVQAVAEPGTVALTSAVQALVAGLFVLGKPRTETFAGGDGPVLRVISPALATRRRRGFSAREPTPYVGREDEIQLLSSRWKRACRGDGQLVLLMGEPGIGKTRLVQEFRRRIEGDPHLWIECAGERLISNTPFHAVTQMLNQGLGWRGDESPQERMEALELALKQGGPQLAEAAPLFAELLNLALPDKQPPSSLPPDQKRKRLLACLTAWVFDLARNQPLVIVIEDLHWVDPSTMELLATLIEQGATGPLMILCTARPEFHANWPMRSHHAQITLDRLSHAETRDLVEGVVAQAGLSQDMIDAVISRTDGVPLFAEELTRLMLESDGRAGPHDIPATLRDSLAARLDRTGRAKEVAQLGAVLGREFSYALIAAVSPMPADQLQAELSKLAAAELIYVRGLPPEANYQFKHALIQDAAYEALLKGRRRELHALVAQTIIEIFPDLGEAEPETLAHHWSAAGETEKAIVAWTTAAAVAAERHAYAEAEERYRKALALLATLPETPERDARELELGGAFVGVLHLTKGFSAPEVVALGARNRALAEKGGKLSQLLQAVQVTWHAAWNAGRYGDAASLADQLLDLAKREGSDASLGAAHFCQLLTRVHRGDLLGTEEHYGILRANAEAWQSVDRAQALFQASLCARMLGYYDQSRERMAEAGEHAGATQQPFYEALFKMSKASSDCWLREPLRAESTAREALEISENLGLAQIGAFARNALGWALAQQGNVDEGVAMCRDAVGQLRERGQMVLITHNLTLLAETEALAGAVDQALATIESALTINPEEQLYRPGNLTLRGELLLRLGQIERAEADFRDAIALARAMSAKAVELRATTSLARQLRARGDVSAAREMLAPICGWFTEGFDTVDLTEAKALVDDLA